MKKLLLLGRCEADRRPGRFAVKKKNEQAKPADPWAKASDQV